MKELDLQEKYLIHFFTERADGLHYKEVKANTVSSKFFVVEDLKHFISETSLNKESYRKLLRTKFNGDEKALIEKFMDFLNEKIKSSMNMAVFINSNHSVTFEGYKLYLFYPSDSVSAGDKHFEENIFSVVQELPYTYKYEDKKHFSFRPDLTFFLNGIFLGYSELKSNWNNQNAKKHGINKVSKDYHKAVSSYLTLAVGNDVTQTIKKDFLKIFEKAIHITSTDVNDTYIIRNIATHFDDIKKYGDYDYDKYHTAISKNFKEYPLINPKASRQEKFEEVFRALFSKKMIEKEILYYNFIERELVIKEGKKKKEYKHNDGRLISPRPKQKFGADKIMSKIDEFLEHENEPDYFINKLKADLQERGLGETQINELIDNRNKYQNNKNVYSLLLQYAAGFGKSNIIGWSALQLKDLRKDKEFVFDKIMLVVDRVQLRDQLDTKMHNMNIEKKMFIEANSKKSFLEALNSNVRIVVVNLQKFGTIKEVLGEEALSRLNSLRVAFLIDEIHRSNSGSTNVEMTSLFDELQSSFDSSKEYKVNHTKKNLIIGFTATPSQHTLARFGEFNNYAEAEKMWAPFDSYTMKEAIDDGYILNPIKGIVPVSSKMYYELPDNELEGFEGDTGYEVIPEGTEEGIDEYGQKYRIRKQKIYANEDRIKAISKFVVDRLVSTIYPNIWGQAKAMLAVSSIKSAIKYHKYVCEYFKEAVQNSKYDKYKDAPIYIVYSSDNQENPSASSLNGGLSEKKVLQKFANEKNGIIIVIEKLQTGFDEPKLHTLFLDKEIRGINAIQTISRVNRKTKHKNDCKVVDFSHKNVNVKNIKEAFEHFSNVVVSDFDPLGDEKVMKTHFVDLSDHLIFKENYDKFLKYEKNKKEYKKVSVIEEITEGFSKFINNNIDDAKKLKKKINRYFQILNLIEFVIDLEDKYKNAYFVDFWRRFNKIYNNINKSDELIDDVEIYFDNKIGIVAPQDYKTQEQKAKYLEPEASYDKEGKQYRFHILAVIEKRNQEEEAIEQLIEDFEKKIIRLFEFIQSDDKGERLIAKILDDSSAFSSDEIYSDFKVVLKKFLIRNRNDLGTFFPKEAKDNINQLCDDFERFLQEEQLQIVKKDDLCGRSVGDLINEGEGNQIELKSSLRLCLKTNTIQKYIGHTAFKNIAAFLNSNGGVLLIGVEDDGNVLGLEETDYTTFNGHDKKDEFMTHLDSQVQSFLGNQYNAYIKVSAHPYKARTVVKICVSGKASSQVFLLKDKDGKKAEDFYIRRSASAVKLSTKEAIEYAKQHWD